MGISNHLLKETKEGNEHQLNFMRSMIEAYMVMFGENPESSDLYRRDNFQF